MHLVLDKSSGSIWELLECEEESGVPRRVKISKKWLIKSLTVTDQPRALDSRHPSCSQDVMKRELTSGVTLYGDRRINR